MSSSKATKDIQRLDEKLGPNDNQRSGTGLFQKSPGCFLLNFVVKDNLTRNTIIFLNGHLVSKLSFSFFNRGKNIDPT